jgi:Ca2+-binding EF-hand superfamily protein
VGKNIQQVTISPYLRDILVKLQADVKKHNLNLRDILNKYKADVIPFDKFKAILREVDLTMTTYEAKALYDFLDKEKTGLVKWEAIKEGIARIDYRKSDNVIERKLDDLVAILRARKEDPRVLFDSIDLNKSGTLDWSEFSKFIMAIAPCYTRQEMLQLFQLLDVDRSGLISKNEFLQFLTVRMPSGKQHVIQEERAGRNLQNFASYLKWSGISAPTILKIADVNGDSQISQEELGALLAKLNFKVSDEEVYEIFSLINKNGDSSICVDELLQLVK